MSHYKVNFFNTFIFKIINQDTFFDPNEKPSRRKRRWLFVKGKIVLFLKDVVHRDIIDDCFFKADNDVFDERSIGIGETG